jgi:hypothetical protein
VSFLSRFGSVTILSLLFFTLSGSAHAYIDGGSGSMLLQMMLATLFGALFVIKSAWSSLKGLVKRPVRIDGRRHRGE